MLSAPVEDLKVEVLEQIGIVSDGRVLRKDAHFAVDLKAYAMLFGVKMTEVDESSGKSNGDSRNKVAENYLLV